MGDTIEESLEDKIGGNDRIREGVELFGKGVEVSREGEGRDVMVWEGCRSVEGRGGKGWNGLGRV